MNKAASELSAVEQRLAGRKGNEHEVRNPTL